MTVILSISGLFKTVLIIIGALVALRFIGQLMNAKRNLDEERALKEKESRQEKERQFVEKNKGKIHISKNDRKAEDVDYEVID